MHHVRNAMPANSNHAMIDFGFSNTLTERAPMQNKPTTNKVKDIFRLTRLLIFLIVRN